MISTVKLRPAVTVLMSVYNGERFLSAAVDSILNQTFTDFELLIIDDASTDQSTDILAAYARQDPRVKVVTNLENLGLTRSLNRGIAMSSGEFLARMDGDDVSFPSRLERQHAYMKAHPGCMILAAEGIVIDEHGRKIKNIRVRMGDAPQSEYLLYRGCPFVHSSLMMRRSFVDDMGGYDERLRIRQDLDLYLRSAAAGIEIHVLNEDLVASRFFTGSISNSGYDNLYLNIALRLKHLQNKKGHSWDLDLLDKFVRDDFRVGHLVRHLASRKQMKSFISAFKNADFRQGCSCATRLVPGLIFLKSFSLRSILDNLEKKLEKRPII